MTRRRTKDPLGKFVGDDPTTPDVNEAWVETPVAGVDPTPEITELIPPPPVAVTPEPAEPVTDPSVTVVTPEPTEPVTDPPVAVTPEPTGLEPGSHEPAVINLKTAGSATIKDKPTKESIEASIQEKLSKRLNSPEVDPFVPSSQLNNEVKEVSRSNGFPLTRGTEVGARLMAKAKRGI